MAHARSRMHSGPSSGLSTRSNLRLPPPSKSVYDTTELYATPDIVADARGSLECLGYVIIQNQARVTTEMFGSRAVGR